MLFLRLLAFAAFVMAGVTQPAAAEQIGPSFDCAAARQPLAQLICTDPDLSQTDLSFAQAYIALVPQLDDAGKRDLKQEDLRFLDAVQQHCGISPTGPVPAQSDVLRKCVKDAYESQRSVWLLRLRPPFSEEANRPIERHLALQRSLQKLAFLPADAKIDGVNGGGTRDAISKWQSAQGRSVTGVLNDADAAAVEQKTPEAKPPAVANNPALDKENATSPDKPVEQRSASTRTPMTEQSPSLEQRGLRSEQIAAGVHAFRVWRSRLEGSPSRREDGIEETRTVVLVGHGADVAPELGAILEGSR